MRGNLHAESLLSSPWYYCTRRGEQKNRKGGDEVWTCYQDVTDCTVVLWLNFITSCDNSSTEQEARDVARDHCGFELHPQMHLCTVEVNSGATEPIPFVRSAHIPVQEKLADFSPTA